MAKRRRRTRTAILAERTIADIKRKEREFLREVSRILSEALGFPVRVSHVKIGDKGTGTPRMERMRRLSKAEARAQVEASFAPAAFPSAIVQSVSDDYEPL